MPTGIEPFQITRKDRTFPHLLLFIISFALSLVGWYSLRSLFCNSRHQLHLVGVVQDELGEVGDPVFPRLVVLDFGWRHALESLVNSGCQLDHVSLNVSLA